jgi:hypothetical protein
MNGQVPNAADFARYRVTNPDQSEVIRQRLYDFQLYPLAGVQQLTFFSQPPGQGITTAAGAVVGSAKNLWDTNLEIPNTLPSGKMFLVESVEVLFYPGSSAAANTFVTALVANFNAVAADAAVASFNDINTVYHSGLLEFNVLSKNYLRETPLIVFPPKTGLDGTAALATNAAATGITSVNGIRNQGRAYYMEPPVVLQPAVNFEIVVRWPAAVPLPSGFNGRIGVALDGYLMRASQ